MYARRQHKIFIILTIALFVIIVSELAFCVCRAVKKSRNKSVFSEAEKMAVLRDNILKGLKGSIVFESNKIGNKEIYSFDIHRGRIKQLTFSKAGNSYPSWSPNGKKIIFTSNRDGNNEIYIMDKNGKNQHRLTDYAGEDVNPSWHPDGKKIIFVSDREKVMNFYFINKDGTDLTKITDFKNGVYDMPRISPDGKEILFTSKMFAGWQVFKMDIASKNTEQVTNSLSGHCEGIWSHDGSKILYVSRFGMGNSDIYIMDKDRKNEQRLTTDDVLDYNPKFSPDDKKIIFSSERNGNWDIYIMDINDKTPLKIISTNAQNNWPDWAD